MESGAGRMRRFPRTEWVMCSTCSGFVFRKRRTSEVVEVVKEAEKMRDLMKAVLLHGPLQVIEPAEATKKQWQDLQRRRRIMMETKRCPACSGSLLQACPTCCHSLLHKYGLDEEGKAMVADPGSKAGFKEKSKRSREEGSEFMVVLPSQGGKERKKVAMEGEAMVADARSEQKSKRSREEGKRSSSGLNEGSGSKKKANRSIEMEGSGSKEAKVERSGSKDEAKIEDIIKLIGRNRETKMEIRRLLKATVEILNEPPVKPQSKEEPKIEDNELAIGNRKTKMATKRMDKKSIDILKKQPPPKPIIYNTLYVNQDMLDTIPAHDKVDCVFLEYLQCHSFIKGYAEYQMEVTDDEDE